MKSKVAPLLVPIVLFGLIASSRAQFASGSDGSYGALNVPANTTATIPLPANGILNCTTVNVSGGATLNFTRNVLNTPVYILATGDVTIGGYIDVSGTAGQPASGLPGDGGPGGFAGGPGGTTSGDGAGAGLGPGGGLAGTQTSDANGAGPGSYATVGSYGKVGSTYGSRLLIPLIGGSGGGGETNGGYGGGGGGGAILIASSTRIVFSGSNYIFAQGGSGYYNGGSGGAIRLVAPVISGSTNFYVGGAAGGGGGRTRIDTLDHSNFTASGLQSAGSVLEVFPNPLPKLSIVGAAGTAIAEGSSAPVTVFLPTGSPAAQQVSVRARDFGGVVPIRVAVIPDAGDPVYTDATIDNTMVNPADGTVNISVPVNVQVHVQVYTH